MSLCCRGKSPGLCCTVVGTEMGVPGNDSLQGRSFDFLGVSDHEFPPWVLWLLGQLHQSLPRSRSMQHTTNFIPHFMAHFRPIKSLAKVLQNLLRITSRCHLTQALTDCSRCQPGANCNTTRCQYG